MQGEKNDSYRQQTLQGARSESRCGGGGGVDCRPPEKRTTLFPDEDKHTEERRRDVVKCMQWYKERTGRESCASHTHSELHFLSEMFSAKENNLHTLKIQLAISIKCTYFAFMNTLVKHKVEGTQKKKTEH